MARGDPVEFVREDLPSQGIRCWNRVQLEDEDGNPIEGANPLPVAGTVGVDVLTIVQTPTITAGAYAANDALGGLLTFANAARVAGGKCTIRSIVVKDLASQDGEIDLVFFDRMFGATADNAPFDPSDADLANVVGHVKMRVSDYIDFVDNSIATRDNLGLSISLLGTSLFAQAVIRGIETYASTSDITIKLVVERH